MGENKVIGKVPADVMANHPRTGYFIVVNKEGDILACKRDEATRAKGIATRKARTAKKQVAQAKRLTKLREVEGRKAQRIADRKAKLQAKMDALNKSTEQKSKVLEKKLKNL